MNKSKSKSNRPSGNGLDTDDDSLEDCAQHLKDLINLERPSKKKIFTNEINPPKLRPSIVQRAFKKNVFVSSTPMFVKGRQHYFSSDSSFNISPIRDEEDYKKEDQNNLPDNELPNKSNKKREKTEYIVISSDLSSICENTNHNQHKPNNTIVSSAKDDVNGSSNRSDKNDKTLTVVLKEPKNSSYEGRSIEDKKNKTQGNESLRINVNNKTSNGHPQEVDNFTSSRSKRRSSGQASAVTLSLHNKIPTRRSTRDSRSSNNNSQGMETRLRSHLKNISPGRISAASHISNQKSPDRSMRRSKSINSDQPEAEYVTKKHLKTTSPGRISAASHISNHKSPDRSMRKSKSVNRDQPDAEYVTKKHLKTTSPGRISAASHILNHKSPDRSMRKSKSVNSDQPEAEYITKKHLKTTSPTRISAASHISNHKSPDRSMRKSKSVNSDQPEAEYVTKNHQQTALSDRVSPVTQNMHTKSPRRSQTLNNPKETEYFSKSGLNNTSPSRVSAVTSSLRNKSLNKSTDHSESSNDNPQETGHIARSRLKSKSPGRVSAVTQSLHNESPSRSKHNSQILNDNPQETNPLSKTRENNISPGRISAVTHSSHRSIRNSKSLNGEPQETGDLTKSRLKSISSNHISDMTQSKNNKSYSINDQNNIISNSIRSDSLTHSINKASDASVRNNIRSTLDSPKAYSIKSGISNTVNKPKNVNDRSSSKTLTEDISTLLKNKENLETTKGQVNIIQENRKDTVFNTIEGDIDAIQELDVNGLTTRSSDLFQNVTLRRKNSESKSPARQLRRKTLGSISEDAITPVQEINLSKRRPRSENILSNFDGAAITTKTSKIPVIRSRSKSVDKVKSIKVLANEIITPKSQVVTLKELCDRGENLMNQSNNNLTKVSVNNKANNLTKQNFLDTHDSSSKENTNYKKRPVPKPRTRRIKKLSVSSTDDSDKQIAVLKDWKSQKNNDSSEILAHNHFAGPSHLNMSTQVGRSLRENLDSRKNSAAFDQRSVASAGTSMTPNNKSSNEDVLNSTVKFVDNSKKNLEVKSGKNIAVLKKNDVGTPTSTSSSSSTSTDYAAKQKRLSDFINRISKKDFRKQKSLSTAEQFRTPNRKIDNRFVQTSCRRSIPLRKLTRLSKVYPELTERQTQTSYKLSHKNVYDSSDSSISNCTKFIDDCAAGDVNLFDSLEPGSMVERFSSSLYDFNVVEHTEMPWRVDDDIKLPLNNSARLSFMKPSYQIRSNSFGRRTKSPVKRKLRQYPNRLYKQSKLITRRRRSSSVSSCDEVFDDSDHSEIEEDNVDVVDDTFVNDVISSPVGSLLQTAADSIQSSAVNNVELLSQAHEKDPKDTETHQNSENQTIAQVDEWLANNVTGNIAECSSKNISIRALSDYQRENRTEMETRNDTDNEHGACVNRRLTNDELIAILTDSNKIRVNGDIRPNKKGIRDTLEDKYQEEPHNVDEQLKNVNNEINKNEDARALCSNEKISTATRSEEERKRRPEMETFNPSNNKSCIDEDEVLTNINNIEILTHSNKKKHNKALSSNIRKITRNSSEDEEGDEREGTGNKKNTNIDDQSTNGNNVNSNEDSRSQSDENERYEMEIYNYIGNEKSKYVEERLKNSKSYDSLIYSNKKEKARDFRSDKKKDSGTVLEYESGKRYNVDTINETSRHIDDRITNADNGSIDNSFHSVVQAANDSNKITEATANFNILKRTKKIADTSLVSNISKMDGQESTEPQEVHTNHSRRRFLQVVLNPIDLDKSTSAQEKSKSSSIVLESTKSRRLLDQRIDYERFKDLATRIEDSQDEEGEAGERGGSNNKDPVFKPPPKKIPRSTKTKDRKTKSVAPPDETTIQLEHEVTGIRRSGRQRRPPTSRFCPLVIISQATKRDAKYFSNVLPRDFKCADCDGRLKICPSTVKKNSNAKSRHTHIHETTENVNNEIEENKRTSNKRSTKSKISTQEVSRKINNTVSAKDRMVTGGDNSILTSTKRSNVNNSLDVGAPLDVVIDTHDDTTSVVGKRGRATNTSRQTKTGRVTRSRSKKNSVIPDEVNEVPEDICTSSEINVNTRNDHVDGLNDVVNGDIYFNNIDHYHNSSLKKSTKDQEVENCEMTQEVYSQAEATGNEMFLKPGTFSRPSPDSGRSTLLKSSFDENSKPLRTGSRYRKSNERKSKKLKRIESANNVEDVAEKNITVSEYVEISSDYGTNSLKFVQKDPVFTKRFDNLSYSDSLDHNNGGSMMYLEIPPGETKKRHTSKKHNLFYFINEGIGRVYIGDRVSAIEKRGRFVIPTGLPYSIINDSPTESLLLACVRMPTS